MYFKDGERGTAQCEKLESIEGGRGTVISSKSGAGGKGLFIRTVNVTIFVSGIFDLFDTMCKRHH